MIDKRLTLTRFKTNQFFSGTDFWDVKISNASRTPHAEHISVLLSFRESAPGYAPGVSLFGINPLQVGQTGLLSI